MAEKSLHSSAAAVPAVGLLRRLAAIVYDSLLLFGVLFVAAAIVVVFNRGEAVRHPLFSVYLLGVGYLFFGWFWTHGGQTLGMRAWKFRVQRFHGGAITWMQALRRFLLAIVSWLLLGLGFLWMLVDKDRMTLHDRFSRTVLVRTKV